MKSWSGHSATDTQQPHAVIGADGVRSRIRELMLGPAFNATYSRKFCFRALVPMDAAVAAVGRRRAGTRFMFNGPGAHVITYPVGADRFLNTLLVLSDAHDWDLAATGGRHTARGAKSEATAALAAWHAVVRDIVGLFPEGPDGDGAKGLDKWAIFDMYDHPADTYAKGSVCLAGDAAHACGPHLGAGAGFGIEDALALVTVLEAARDAEAEAETASAAAGGKPTPSRAGILSKAVQAYSDVRMERTQWLVRETRAAVDLFQWQDKEVGSDAELFGREITWRFHKIWEHDTEGMVKEVLQGFQTRLQSG